MTKKLKFVWSCSDYVKHEHRTRLSAWMCGRLQKARRSKCIWTRYNFVPNTLEETFTTSCMGKRFITRMPVDEMDYCHRCGKKVKRSTKEEENANT